MVSPVNKSFSLKSVLDRLSHWPDNEKEVGEGIKASGVPRSKIFLTTKLNNIDHKDVLGALNNSLELLGTDYVDLCAGLSPHDRNQLLTRCRLDALARSHDQRREGR